MAKPVREFFELETDDERKAWIAELKSGEAPGHITATLRRGDVVGAFRDVEPMAEFYSAFERLLWLVDHFETHRHNVDEMPTCGLCEPVLMMTTLIDVLGGLRSHENGEVELDPKDIAEQVSAYFAEQMKERD